MSKRSNRASRFANEQARKFPVNAPNVALFQRQMLAKFFQATVGDAVSLLLRSEELRGFSIADLEWLLLPPLIERQVLFKYAQLDRSTGRDGEAGNQQPSKYPSVPVGMIAWAMISADVEAKLDAQRGTGAPYRLEPADWKSGTIPRVIYAVGDTSTIDYLTVEFKRRLNENESAGVM